MKAKVKSQNHFKHSCCNPVNPYNPLIRGPNFFKTPCKHPGRLFASLPTFDATDASLVPNLHT